MEENIIGNVKAGRVRIYKFSTFKAFTEEENAICNDKKKSQEELLEEIRKFKTDETRSIDGKYLYHNYKNTDGKIDKSKENENYQIAIFENDIVRLALDDRKEVAPNYQLLDEIIYLEIRHNHNDILKQIIKKGIIIADEKYILYTATTGQVRNTTVTLMKEDFFEKHKGYLLVGLTEEKVNEKCGIDTECGMNVGKYLAYKALPLSSSVLPAKEIDIDRCILVRGLETTITDMVKYIDIQKDENGQCYVADTPKDFVEKSIKIEHTDGAGMFLPGELPSSCQIRGGFFKGAMFPFDFRKFAKEIAHNSKVVDAYGGEIDIEEQDIKYIFTTSQLKMWKKYSSWDDYKKAFKENEIKISINSYANPAKDTVNFSYQYLQTLPYGCDITKLCDPAKEDLIKLHSDLEYVKEAMGYTDEGDAAQKSSGNALIAKALEIYPQLIYDSHIMEKIKGMVKAKRRNYLGGKIPVSGYYSYAAPDMYAFCEYLFCGNNNPAGLIPKNHIYNKYYDEKGTVEHVICLRSPHLSRYEYGKRGLHKSDECKKWFEYMESDTIVSCHDLLSKTLQMDWDGDEILVSDDIALYELAKELPVEPLYYEMPQAKSQMITSKTVYDTLIKGFDNNVIGDSSNAITKLWNTPEATDEDTTPYDDAINVFCAYSNYAIDYPKTGKSLLLGEYEGLYNDLVLSKSGRERFQPHEIKCPNFFIEAKNKKRKSVEAPTSNVADRVKIHIAKGTAPHYAYFKDKDDKFDYRMLMNNEVRDDKTAKYEVGRYNKNYQELYLSLKNRKKLKKELCKKINEDINKKNTNVIEISERFELFHYYCIQEIKKIFTTKSGWFNENLAVNYLIDMEYSQNDFVTGSKDILWKCFGHIIIQNLKRNTKSDITIKFRPRLAYKKAMDGDTDLDKKIEKLMEHRHVDITDNDNTFIESFLQGIKKKKNGSHYNNDQELFFTLYCLYKEANDNNRLKNSALIISNKKQKNGKKLNMNVIMSIAGVKSYASSIERFENANGIKIEKDKDCIKIKIDIPEENEDQKKILFKVENIYNPIIYWKAYEQGETLRQCKICRKDFIKSSNNQKTCSDKCKDELHEFNQKRVNEKNRQAKMKQAI